MVSRRQMSQDYAYARLLIHTFNGMDFTGTLPDKRLPRNVIKSRWYGGYRYFYVMPFGRFVEL